MEGHTQIADELKRMEHRVKQVYWKELTAKLLQREGPHLGSSI